MVSGLDFNAMFTSNNEVDDETTGVARLLCALRDEFADQMFTASDVAALLDPMHGVSSVTAFVMSATQQKAEAERLQKIGDTLRGALEDASGKAFPPGIPSVHKVGKKLHVLDVGC